MPGLLEVPFHGRGEGVVGQVTREPAQVQAQGTGITLEIELLQATLVGIDHVVHLPELALGPGRQGRLVGQGRLLVKGQGEVLEHQPHLVWILLEQLLQGGVQPGAVGALEIGEHHHHHRGLLRAQAGGIADVHLANLDLFRLGSPFLLPGGGPALAVAAGHQAPVESVAGAAGRPGLGEQWPGHLQEIVETAGAAGLAYDAGSGNFTVEVPAQISDFKFLRWEDGLRQRSRVMTNYAGWVTAALYSTPSSLKVEVKPEDREAEIKIILEDYFGAGIPNAEIKLYTSTDMATWKLLGRLWTDEKGEGSLKLSRRDFDYYVKAEFAGEGEELQPSSATATVSSYREEAPTEEAGLPTELLIGIAVFVGVIAIILGIYKAKHAIPARRSRRVLRPVSWMPNTYIPFPSWRR